jgi:hypothetical protein
MKLLVTMLLFMLALSTLALAQPPTHPTGPTAPPTAAPSRPFSIEGRFVEACTCHSACAAEITGDNPGCDAAGGFQFDKGSLDGHDFSGTRLAFAIDHLDHVHLYLDAPDEARRKALEAFARAAFAPAGTIDDVSVAPIEIAGKDGGYTLKVGGGKTMTLETEAVLGGDHETPVRHENTQNPLNPTIFQGRCLSCRYSDGEHAITIPKVGNSFFNQKMKAAGRL